MVALGILAVIALGLVGVWFGVVAPRETRRSELEAKLSRALAARSDERWERPVLRGEPIDGNAYDAEQDAARPFASLDEALFATMPLALSRGEPTEAQREAITANREALAQLRRGTQRTWSWGDESIEQAALHDLPDYMPRMRGAKLLLLSALDQQPGECLALTADSLRVMQDASAGGGMLPLIMLSSLAQDALAVGGRCLREADPQALEQAAHDFGILAQNPPDTGEAMEYERLYLGVVFREEAKLIPSYPTDSLTWERFRRGSDLLDAWALAMGDPAEARTYGRDYPADIERAGAQHDEVEARENDLLSIPNFAAYLHLDASTRAITRMLWAGARLRLAHAETSAARPALLDERVLLDPTTGEPFVWRHDDAVTQIESTRPDVLRQGSLRLVLRESAPRPPPLPDSNGAPADADANAATADADAERAGEPAVDPDAPPPAGAPPPGQVPTVSVPDVPTATGEIPTPSVPNVPPPNAPPGSAPTPSAPSTDPVRVAPPPPGAPAPGTALAPTPPPSSPETSAPR